MQNTLHSRKLTSEDERILGKLLVEALNGEISPETHDELEKLGDYGELPDPFGHIVGYIGAYAGTGKELAAMVVDELRIYGMEKLEARTKEPTPIDDKKS